MTKHIPILYLTEIEDGTVINGDDPNMISKIMIDNGKAYWVELLASIQPKEMK